jgi:hypothetical protein
MSITNIPLPFLADNANIKSEKDLDLMDDQVYQALVIEKLSGIEKMLFRIVSKDTDIRPKKNFTPSQKFNQSSIEIANREIATIGIVNFLPANTLQELMDLENSISSNAKMFKDVVSLIFFSNKLCLLNKNSVLLSNV